jgi:hypothetical protein
MNNYKRVTILAAIAGLAGTALVVTTRVRAQSIAAITVLQDVKMESYPGPVIKSGQRLESVAGFGKALLERDDSAYATVPVFITAFCKWQTAAGSTFSIRFKPKRPITRVRPPATLQTKAGPSRINALRQAIISMVSKA